MGRFFTVLASIAMAMILAAGGGVYWALRSDIIKANHESIETMASGIGFRISAQIKLLNESLDGMTQDPELITAVTQYTNTGNIEDLSLIKQIAARLQLYLPGVLKLRILMPGQNSLDKTAVPHLGYADLEMVKETFKKHQYPSIQGDKGPNRHLAIARRIVKNDQVLGIILASLNYDFLQTSLNKTGAIDDLIELKQAKLILHAAGNQSLKEKSASGQIEIANTHWIIQYWYSDSIKSSDTLLIVSAIVLPIFIAGLIFLFGFRSIMQIFRTDQLSVLKAVKDMMTGKTQGNYPVQFDEMRVIISTLIQFKRVLDSGEIKTDSSGIDQQDNDLTDFFEVYQDGNDLSDFFDAPEGVNFMNSAEGIDVHESDEDPELPSAPLPELDEQPATAPPPIPTTVSTASKNEAVSIPQTTGLDNLSRLGQTTDATSTIFRAYDIRGIVGKTLTNQVVMDIGRALGSAAQEIDCSTVIIARDGRLSSPSLSESLAASILSTGRNVLDLGMVPTPVLYFVVQHHDGHTGVMITGSHNPSEYNGLKMIVGGETLAGEKIQKLKQRIDDQDFIEEEAGTVKQNNMFVNEYIGMISEDIHIDRPMKVVLDCGNGVAGELGPTLLKTLGCEVIELFCEIDGNFPNHHPDPSKPENLEDLISAVQHYQADLGVAIDGDGDRIVVIDSAGKIIWPDRQMMLYAEDVLKNKPGAEIIYDVKCSKLLADHIVKHGGRPLMWKTGHSLMKAKLKQTAAKLAGEMSGHIYFNDRWFGFDDALYTASRMIELLSRDTRTSHEVFADLPDAINTPELNIELTEGENFKFIDQLLEKAAFADGKVTDIDGLRVDFADGWGLVRASNTTPSLVMRFEADNNETLIKIQGQFKQLMLQIKPDILLPF